MTKTQIGTASVSSGEATTEWTIPSDVTPGSHTIYATYVQNDNYMTATGYNTAEIRIPTVTTITDVVGSIGETVTLTANVKYNTNQNVNEGTVQFQCKTAEESEYTNIGTAVNVSSGVATLQYTIPNNVDDGTVLDIRATFIETTTYGASVSAAGDLAIREGTTVVVQNISANRDTSATITATITDSDGDNVDSGQAQLYIDNTASGQPQSVSDGSVSFTYSVANNAVLGGHSIKVSYIENDDYEGADGTATLTVRTPTTLTAVNVSANKGDQNVPLTVNVTDPNNAAVPSGTVQITVGNGSAVDAVVNSSGVATINYNIPNDASGTITFSAVYVENTNYQGSTMAVDGVITVRLGTTIVVDSIKAELGDTIDLSSTVTDENSDVVDEGTVNYEIE
ncbi:MAG: hypothetical protein BZ138_07285 [Methanosphaera sp. rholeuAM270]|nr:MAG: hypothetical protein BZ138_07285 [Methanosphaera sp. rholeuAM270]